MAGSSAQPVIVWFRRDLRLSDNPALMAALRMSPAVIPVYVFAPEEEGQFQPGRCSRWWLHKSLEALDQDLRALGSRLLCFRAADSLSLLAALAARLGAQAVLFNHLYDPISMVRDNEVKAGLVAAGFYCQSFNADILREPWETLDTAGRPFTSYDAFWTAHCRLPYPPPPPLPMPAAMPPLPAGLGLEAGAVELAELCIMTPEEEMSNMQLDYHWRPGSAGAHRLLDEFLRSGRLKQFDCDRAKTDRASTSRLSPHIHYGEVSVRHIHFVCKQLEAQWARAGEGGTSVSDFLRQLGYREYSRYLSFHFPFTHERSLLEHLRAVPWRFDQRLFKAWRQGRTGYPLVDAAMREVWGTGWMHNRMRVVAASFMVKNLLLPWQWGLKHYWDALLDADLECDSLGWQYVAGCMADAHEFSHIIDYSAESKRFDPDGNYVRRWLPVLARLPAKYIHEPWLAPQEVLEDAGVELGCNYPYPVIDVEESVVALKAADAVVQQCLRDTSAAAAAGPFRPATDAEPEEAERLFEENYQTALLYGPPVAAPGLQDRTEGCGTTDGVQSHVTGQTDSGLVPPCELQPQQQQQQEEQQNGTAPAAAPATAAAAAAGTAAAPKWDSQPCPSGAAVAHAGGATSAAPAAALRQAEKQLQGKRPAASLEEAATRMLPGSAQGSEQCQRPGSVPGLAWQPVGKSRQSGSGGGTASGTGHGTLTHMRLASSSNGGAAAGSQHAQQRQGHRPLLQPLNRSAGVLQARHGTCSLGSATPALAPAGVRALAAGLSADTQQQWAPPEQLKLAAAASQPAAMEQGEEAAGDAPSSCKRLRARSPAAVPHG
ncbi:hypothetical protein D9Q98_003213 [Chlorella vulgaris]|uniref:Photolyase/cryptochrome alpha/beta domain-containing protein n=1 Tax=Chlorella vulgaris TaxID=3077 RepID=A0A9D4YY99_CHLVU|nr:hypothetical protein D9Q98_003213 [Chlorella vulgaris]